MGDSSEVRLVSPLEPIEPARVISLRAGTSLPKLTSYVFDPRRLPAPGTIEDRRAGSTPDPPARHGAAALERRRTATPRCRPPQGVVRIKDRLFYLLQPPLQSLARCGEITFHREPFPHQYAGISFLFPRRAAILADDMGLGKTMQAITAIRLLVRAGEVRRVLLVCPKPLVTNWRREFEAWAPELPLCLIEGDAARRLWQWQSADTPVKIGNYELLVRDQQVFADRAVEFDLVVLDEAQRIKNRDSLTNRAVGSIRRRRSWALTGTPVENSLHDLVGIFEFLAPGVVHAGQTPREMAYATRDYLLRRTKQQVLRDLPPRLDRDAELELTSPQRQTYEQAEQDGIVRLNDLGAAITIQHVFELVMRLKQICNFDPATGESSKMERLQADLAEVVASGQKAIVFSQWVETLHAIQARIPECRPLAYHGRIPHRVREAILEQFRSDPRHTVLLMSYGAGSVGLNLQFCQYVFLFDRWWNPAVEDQAVNRAHRLGSVGSVTVTRMLVLETIEERIHAILEKKRELFDTIVGGALQPRQLGLTRDEVFSLFQLAPGVRAPGRVA